MAHGTDDPVVPFELGEAACEKLRALGLEIEWHSYPMEHHVCAREIADIGAWLNRVL